MNNLSLIFFQKNTYYVLVFWATCIKIQYPTFIRIVCEWSLSRKVNLLYLPTYLSSTDGCTKLGKWVVGGCNIGADVADKVEWICWRKFFNSIKLQFFSHKNWPESWMAEFPLQNSIWILKLLILGTYFTEHTTTYSDSKDMIFH